MVKGKLAKQLKNLGLIETFCTKFNLEGSLGGWHQIDRVWYTGKIVPTAVTICPYHLGAGNHKTYVIDFQMNIIFW